MADQGSPRSDILDQSRPGVKLARRVCQGRAAVAVGSERDHAACFEVRSIGLVDLEVESIVGDQGEEQLARVDTDAAEHAPGADTWDDPAQLVNDEGSEARADWHLRKVGGKGLAAACRMRPAEGHHNLESRVVRDVRLLRTLRASTTIYPRDAQPDSLQPGSCAAASHQNWHRFDVSETRSCRRGEVRKAPSRRFRCDDGSSLPGHS